MRELRHALGRIRVRLLAVNLLALLVPALGLEFARIHERELLDALERDMSNQAVLVRAFVESSLAGGAGLDNPEHQRVLLSAARRTRTRIRLVDPSGAVVADSHAEGPPEGPEPPPPYMLPRPDMPSLDVVREVREVLADRGERWPNLAERTSKRSASSGHFSPGQRMSSACRTSRGRGSIDGGGGSGPSGGPSACESATTTPPVSTSRIRVRVRCAAVARIF